MKKLWFKHDRHAHRDFKVIALLARSGPAAYGLYWIINEILLEQEGYKLPLDKKTLQALAGLAHYPAEDVEQLLRVLIDFELYQTDGDFFWSKRLQDDAEMFAVVTEKRRRAGLARAHKQAAHAQHVLSTCSTHAQQVLSTCSANEPKDIRSKIEDLRSDLGIPKGSNNAQRQDHARVREGLNYGLPKPLANDRSAALWEKWITHKAKLNAPYKTQETIDEELRQFEQTSARFFADSIAHCIKRGLKYLEPLRGADIASPPPKPPPAPSGKEKALLAQLGVNPKTMEKRHA